MVEITSDKGQPTVLVIHQGADVVAMCRQVLEKQGFVLEHVALGNEGLNRIYSLIPDVIIVGSAVPELNGYQICRLVKHDPVMKKIPIILVADVAEKMDRFWGVKAGADEFMPKDELQAKLLKKVQMLLEIYDRMGIHEKTVLRNMHAHSPFNIRTRLNQILDTSLIESTLMVEFRSLTDLIHDATLLNYMLFSLLESLIDYDAAAVFYNDDNKGPRTLTVHLPEGGVLPQSAIDELRDRFFEPLKPKARVPQAFEVLETEVIGATDENAEPIDFLTVHMREVTVDGRLIGAIAFYSRHKVDYRQIFPVQLVEDELRLLMKLRHLYSQAETLAITDSLTGLFNHRHFMMTLQREFKSSKRYEIDMALAIIGVDQFRQINEQWGHACGDEILRHIARIAEESFRNVDIPARFGGKHLAIVFPKTPADQALIPLERFQKRVAETPMEWEGQSLSITVSVGLTGISERVNDISELIRETEEALQQAREQGRNRIEICAT